VLGAKAEGAWPAQAFVGRDDEVGVGPGVNELPR
jgi:hypothetical protein